MKNENELWKEYDETHDLCKQSVKDLSWHIENAHNQRSVMSMATDMIKATQSYTMRTILIPSIANQLDHQDYDIRSHALFCLITRMRLEEYGKKAFDMARYDPDEAVREEALGNLGFIINEMDKDIAQKMAWSMYEVLINEDLEKYGKSYRDRASDSVLSAMRLNYLAFGRAWNDPDFDPIWKDFVKKYKLEYKPVFRR
jgi:hypothetical protein